MSGLEAGRIHSLGVAMSTIGRSRACSLRFDAGIVRDGASYFVEDSGSLNGTFVNERRVQKAPLKDGDRVRLGSGASLRFQLVDEDEERTLIHLYASSVYDGLTGVFNRKQ